MWSGHSKRKYRVERRFVSPDGVSAVLGKVLEAHASFYDYKDRLRNLLERLVEKDKKQDVISYAERLRGLKGIPELFVTD